MNGKKIKRSVVSSVQVFWKRSSGIIIGLIIFIVIVYLLFSLNIFFVNKFEISCLDQDNLVYIEEEEIRDTLSKYIGIRLFELNTFEVENKLKEKFTFMEEVYVNKRIPNSLSVVIIERKPTLILNISKIDYLLDRTGFVLINCKDNEDYCNNLPILKIKNYLGDIEAGKKPFISEIDKVVQILEKQKTIGDDIVQIYIPENNVISIQLEDDTRAIFSGNKSISDQINIFVYTRENLKLKNENYKEIDVRFDRPVIRVDKYTY